MDQNQLVVVTFLVAFLLHSEIIMSIVAEPVFSFIRDFVQYNIVGLPVIHQKTKWEFDPEVGKQRRVRYEQENGRFGENAIAKNGMGIGYKGPWGEPMNN